MLIGAWLFLMISGAAIIGCSIAGHPTADYVGVSSCRFDRHVVLIIAPS
jgi:hypothetical protein